MNRRESPLVAGTWLLGDQNNPLFTHSLQHGSRYTGAVADTVKGSGSYDFNPWERYEFDGGYCLDAPGKIPAGSHTAYDGRHVFSKELFRE